MALASYARTCSVRSPSLPSSFLLCLLSSLSLFTSPLPLEIFTPVVGIRRRLLTGKHLILTTQAVPRLQESRSVALNADSLLGQPGGSDARSFRPSADSSSRDLEVGGQRVSCRPSLGRCVAKDACDRERAISWAQPKPMLPPASLRQLATRASLEVREPFGITGLHLP